MDLLRNRRGFRLLALAYLSSELGDWLLAVALPYYIFRLTGSALASAATFFAIIAPQVVVGPLVGAFVDSSNRARRGLLVAALGVGALCTGALLVFLHTSLLIWVIYPILLIQGSALQVFMTARTTVLPQLIRPDEYLPASSVISVVEQVARLLGPPIGGLLLVAFGLSSVVSIDVASFLLSMGFVSLIRESLDAADGSRGQSPTNGSGPKVFRQIRDGIVVMYSQAPLRMVGIVTVISATIGGAMIGIIVPFATQNLRFSARSTGLLLACQAAGAICATPLIVRVARRITPTTAFAVALLGSAVPLLVLSIVPSPAVAFAAIAAYGAVSVMTLIVARTVILAEAKSEFLGRIVSGMTTLLTASLAMGALMVGLFAVTVGISDVLRLGSILAVVGSGFVLKFGHVWARRSTEASAIFPTVN